MFKLESIIIAVMFASVFAGTLAMLLWLTAQILR